MSLNAEQRKNAQSSAASGAQKLDVSKTVQTKRKGISATACEDLTFSVIAAQPWE
jgi:hypothetical protein